MLTQANALHLAQQSRQERLLSSVAAVVTLHQQRAMLIPDAPGANNATAQNTQAVLQDALMQEHAIHTAGKDSAVQNATTHRADALQRHSAVEQFIRLVHGHALAHVHAYMVLGFPAHVHSQRQIAEHSAVLTVTAWLHALLIKNIYILTEHAA
jgi:hypothetical protein